MVQFGHESKFRVFNAFQMDGTFGPTSHTCEKVEFICQAVDDAIGVEERVDIDVWIASRLKSLKKRIRQSK